MSRKQAASVSGSLETRRCGFKTVTDHRTYFDHFHYVTIPQGLVKTASFTLIWETGTQFVIKDSSTNAALL